MVLTYAFPIGYILWIYTLTTKPTRGCPQGGVLSPMLGSLVVDDLLNILSAQGYEVIGLF